MKNLSNIVGFQVAWWACILGAENGFPFIGPVLMAAYLIAHYYFISSDRNEVKLIIIFTVFGTFVDSLLTLSGLVTYVGYYGPGSVIAPLWIIAMWSGFTSTVNHSMPWLKDRLMMGELYQNNHHKAPRKINFANRWFEIDLGYLFASFLQKLNIVKINKAT